MPFSTNRETLERQCEMTFIRVGGPGGQHRNRRETGIRLFHPPSGIVVQAVERRDRTQNIEIAFRRLIERLERLNHVPKKRKATRPSAASVRKRLEKKRMQARRKVLRKKPSDFD